MVAEVTTGDHSERAHGGQRARLGAAEAVLTIAIVHDLSVSPARQMNVAAERVPRLAVAILRVPIVKVKPLDLEAHLKVFY
jgi:hypothetical protein